MARTLFTNVTIIDGSGAEPFAGQVLLEGNRIKAVARGNDPFPTDQVRPADQRPGDQRTGEPPRSIDGGGATLMPGLVEAHAHISFANTATLDGLGDIPPEEHTLIAAEHAKLLLDHGFTSINSMAAAKRRLDVVIRNAIVAGRIPGPRMLASSPELTVSGGLGDVRKDHIYRESFAVVCDGAEEFRRVAREMVREGVDTLKINPAGDALVPSALADQTVMTDAEIAAVVEVARSRGRRVAAHARAAESVKMCVRHGIDLINHATLCDAEALDMLESAKERVFVMPTLGITYTTLYEAGQWGISQEAAESFGLKRELEIAIGVMKELKRRGVRVLPGGDYGFAWNPMGNNARDLEHFVKLLGYTPLEAISAATRLGGQLMMKGDELGQIKPGCLADLLLVDGNPAQDVSILRERTRLLAIMKDGVFHKTPPVRAAAAPAVAAE